MGVDNEKIELAAGWHGNGSAKWPGALSDEPKSTLARVSSPLRRR